jgi:peroxin-12
MAEGDELRPSYFEVFASERLTGTLRPALRFVLEVLSVRNPSLMALAGRSDDIFAMLSAVLETSQLVKHSATIAESFYGLRRSTSFSASKALSSGRRRLSTGQVAASVFLSVLVPYAKVKLDASFAAESGGALRELIRPAARGAIRVGPNAGSLSSRGTNRPAGTPRTFREFASFIRELATRFYAAEHFIRWYPPCSALYEGVALMFNMLYMFGHTRYFSPSLALQGLVVRRLTAREIQGHVIRGRLGNSKGRERRPALAAISSGADAVLSAAKYAFVAGIFAFRFLEYYYAAEVSVRVISRQPNSMSLSTLLTFSCCDNTCCCELHTTESASASASCRSPSS